MTRAAFGSVGAGLLLRMATFRESGRREWRFGNTGMVRCSAIGDAHAEWSHGDMLETWGDKEAARVVLRGLLAPKVAEELVAEMQRLRNAAADDSRVPDGEREKSKQRRARHRVRVFTNVLAKLRALGLHPDASGKE